MSHATPFVPLSSNDSLHARAVTAANEAAYQWTIGSDVLAWSNNASAVLGRKADDLSTGKRYSSQLHAENMTSRFDAVMHSVERPRAEGVPFRIEYELKATDDGPGIWVEDTGSWYPDAEGRPAEVVGIVRQINDRHAADQKLNYLSRNDSLTGMMNRSRMNEVLGEAIDAAAEGGTPLAFAVAAINNLNVINEAYGFDVADEVIAAVSRRLRSVMRGGDGIARYSGSKFGIILNACTVAELPSALERFLLAVRESVIETKCGPVWALLSVGAVAVPESAKTAAEAMACAEESLNRALRQPSDCFDLYTKSDERESQRALNARCATEIIDCLKSGVFHLAFQPLVEAKSGQAMIHEGLLRMRDTAGEVVAAGHLVPVAERLGLVRLIDRAVVQLALEALHRHEDARISINVSATTANDTRWNSQIIDMIAAAAPLNERLIVEITETTALSDLPGALTFFEKLRAVGCCIAIDDFGAGFSSFRNLRDLPIDIIKLDGSYCRNLKGSPENAYFVRMLIELAHRFDIKTVAEWVENEDDATFLRDLGIDYMQGNLYGQPELSPPWTRAEEPGFDFEAELQMQAAPELEVPELETNAPEEQRAIEITGPAIAHMIAEPLQETEVPVIASDLQEEAEASLNSLKGVLEELSRHFPQDKSAEHPEDERLAG